MNEPPKYSFRSQPYEKAPVRGWYVIPVLHFLWGEALSDDILCYLGALRPSSVRICTTSATCDAQTWGVTVWLDGDKVNKIEQKVEIDLWKFDEEKFMDKNYDRESTSKLADRVGLNSKIIKHFRRQ